jgi:hypothetical protein
MSGPYKYHSLKEGWIRVLQLKPARYRNKPLQGTLVEVKLEPEQSYETLSYVWGARTGNCPIICDGKEILVTENCEAALRQLRLAKKPITIWIDAICINQSDELERNSQVRIMDDIYKYSKHLRIWIGNPESSRGLRRFNLYLQALIALNRPVQWTGEHMPALYTITNLVCRILLESPLSCCKYYLYHTLSPF